MVVPADLRPLIGRSEVVRSLRTTCKTEARARWHHAEAQVRSLFSELRRLRHRMSDDQLRALAEQFLYDQLDAAETMAARVIAVAPSNPDEIDLRTDQLTDLLTAADERFATPAHQRQIQGLADALIADAGLTVDRDSDEYRRFCLRLYRAQQEAARAELRALQGDLGAFPALSAGAKATRPISAGPTLSEALTRYRAFKAAQGAWTAKSAQIHEALLQELVEIVGDKPLASLTKSDLLGYYEALPKLPSNAAKKWPGLDARAVLQSTAALTVDRLAPKSINKRLSAVKAFLGWAVDADLLPTNPGTVLRPVPEGNARDARAPLTDAEVRAFLAKCDSEARDEAHRLIPMLCAYSGLRLNEAAQLDRDDIRQVDGRWVCDINGEGEKELKTPTAKRLVPVHPAIVEALLAHRETLKAGNLWQLPKGRDGHSGPLSKWFARRLDEIVDDDRKTFHSLRHSVATKLKGQGVEEYLIEGLLGHSSRSMSTGRYGKAIPIAKLAEVVERISYNK